MYPIQIVHFSVTEGILDKMADSWGDQTRVRVILVTASPAVSCKGRRKQVKMVVARMPENSRPLGLFNDTKQTYIFCHTE